MLPIASLSSPSGYEAAAWRDTLTFRDISTCIFLEYGRYKAHLCFPNTNDPLLDMFGGKKETSAVLAQQEVEAGIVALLG